MQKPNSNDFYAYYSSWRNRQMSDHLPMWVEFHIDFSEDYLNEVEDEIERSLQN